MSFNLQSSIGRAGDGIRTHDLLLGKETYYHCTTPADHRPIVQLAESAETQDRTGDTAIFSRVLYQLSYLGQYYFVVKRGGFYTYL